MPAEAVTPSRYLKTQRAPKRGERGRRACCSASLFVKITDRKGYGMPHTEPDTSDCYTQPGDPSGTGVNRYAIALLRGTANAGELDKYNH